MTINKITICCSSVFHKNAVDIKNDLKSLGFDVELPSMAEQMNKSGDFDASKYQTWLSNPDDYKKRSELMRDHLVKISEGDAVLVLNYEKNGIQNYIGPNVLIEMSLAFWLKKPIYLINKIPEGSSFIDEIKSMEPIELNGDVSKIKVA